MREYTVCNVADAAVFEQQCRALEKNILGLSKAKDLVDVDGSIIRSYTVNGRVIEVRNDKYIGCVSMTSEIELEQFFM